MYGVFSGMNRCLMIGCSLFEYMGCVLYMSTCMGCVLYIRVHGVCSLYEYIGLYEYMGCVQLV